jgi:hypothetical protein
MVSRPAAIAAGPIDFGQQPLPINGFSELLVEVFGEERGKGGRSAVGMTSLPANQLVEVEDALRERIRVFKHVDRMLVPLGACSGTGGSNGKNRPLQTGEPCLRTGIRLADGRVERAGCSPQPSGRT